MKKVKLLSAILASALAVSALAGCGETNTASKSGEDPNTVPSDTYEINWYLQGTPQDDVASVEEAVNEYLKDKINATLKIHRLESSQYQQQLTTMMQAGEYFDMAFVANWCLDYKANARNGAFLALDDYIDKYLPKTIENMGEDVLNNARVDGKVYAIPNMKELAESRGWTFRPDIAEKYNIDMSSIKTLDELKPYLQTIKANEPDMQYPIDWGSDRTPASLLRYDESIASGVAIFYDGSYDGKVVSLTETPEFMDACKTANEFYNDGLIKRDIATASDFEQRVKDGKTFCYIDFLKPGKAKETCANYAFELDQADVSPIYEYNGAGIGSMNAISRTSKNPERVLRFLELLNTDPYLNNLINFGIEGKHYTTNEDGRIHIEPDTSYTMNGYQWMTANIFVNKLTDKEDPDKLEQMREFNKNAIKVPTYGFDFDPTAVEMEISALKTVSSQYNKQVTMGAQDPETVMPEYTQKLKEAGLQKVIDEAQKQYDEFLASKN